MSATGKEPVDPAVIRELLLQQGEAPQEETA
jgi:hypothetical protein